MKRRKLLSLVLRCALLLFLLMNGIAFMHAYRFTHFADATIERTPTTLSFPQKLKLLFTGVANPRPLNRSRPAQPYETVQVQSNVPLECWLLRTEGAKGTIILFHGYGGEKSSMLDKATVFLELGYNALLVDFMGSGGSGGRRTTIGFHEAEEVKDCFNYLVNRGFTNIHLFGTSMGAVAILKAIADHQLQPASIIIECPFGTMYQTVCARFRNYNVPTVPMAALLVFWGGVQHGYWAFSHNPVEYARQVSCPALLLYGQKDERVSREEIDLVYNNLKGTKQLVTYPQAGHENYLLKYKTEWTTDVAAFLTLVSTKK